MIITDSSEIKPGGDERESQEQHHRQAWQPWKSHHDQIDHPS